MAIDRAPRFKSPSGSSRRRSSRSGAAQLNPDELENPELVIGLVAGVGAPLDWVQRTVAKQLRLLGYITEVLHLSEMTNRFELPTARPKRGVGEDRRINAMMNRGNEARIATGRNDILGSSRLSTSSPIRRVARFVSSTTRSQSRRLARSACCSDLSSESLRLVSRTCSRCGLPKVSRYLAKATEAFRF